MTGFLKADEVVEICKVSKPMAYKIIREINDEMKSEGYLTIRGRVNKRFLFKKLGIGGEDNVSY
ncbi:transcriptional regulator [Fusobacterium hominis]|uniref:transcriptional regulator n=1 Tax=Fusobacterium hominis TaxID=2764326 RepID=UPI0022E4071E|nr:transcriptional regulator [Fusobacterium hominis]